MAASSRLLDGVAPLANPDTIFALLPIATTFFWYSVQYYMSPLRKYPGPVLGGKSSPEWDKSSSVQRTKLSGSDGHPGSLDQLLPNVPCPQGRLTLGH